MGCVCQALLTAARRSGCVGALRGATLVTLDDVGRVFYCRTVLLLQRVARLNHSARVGFCCDALRVRFVHKPRALRTLIGDWFMEDESPWEFRLEIVAQSTDIDGLGHVSNITYVKWIQDAATSHSAYAGFTAEDYVRIGAVFMVRRHEVDYLRSAYEGDAIALITRVASFKGASSQRLTRIERIADGTVLVRANTQWAYVSYATGRPTRIPQDMADAFLSAR
jgi:acyl-CoA thioester hydrolase